ncbi:MAG: hypothetical protein ABFC28_03205 [Rikenellaceae bacterium]
MQNNRKVIRVLLVVMFLSAGRLFCQDQVRGVIISKEEGTAISNARVCIYDAESKGILGYTFSLKDGSFVVKSGNSKESFYLEVSSMGFTKFRKKFDSFPGESQRVELERADFELKEVTVTAPKVTQTGDTINFITSGFAKEQDRSIGEVLKRIPGIDVSKSGQVTYKEKPINALYIDGKNLLDEQYGIATQNIKPDLISMIQIFENHQPIKVLQKITPSENAVINLKLDPKVKAKWIASADLRVGVAPALWDSRLLLFQFNKNFQSMNVIKSNNVGKDVRGEFRHQNLGAAAESQLISAEDQNLVNVTGIASPPIEEQRNMFNQSCLISSNSLFSLGKNLEGVVKLNYIYDFQEREQNQRVEYIIDGADNIVIDENNSYKGFMNSPEIDIVLKSNTPGSFIQNRINGKMRFSNNFASTGGTSIIEQRARLRQYDLSEIFTFIQPLKKTLLRVNSNTQLRSLPQALTITSDAIEQSISYFQVQSNNTAGLTRSFAKLATEINGGVNITYQKMKSNLTGFNETNNFEWSFTELFVAPSVRYETDAVRLTVAVPLKLQNSKFRFTPNVALRYKFSPFWEGWLSYSFNTTHTDISDMNNSSVLLDYRSISKGYNEMLESRYSVISLRGIYNNPLKLFNLFGSINYNYNQNGYTVSMIYSDFYNTRIILPDERASSGLSFTFDAAKSFFDMPLLLDLKTSYFISGNSLVQQGVDTRFKTHSWSIIPRIEVTLSNSLSVDFNLQISVLKRTSDSGTFSSSIRSDYNPNLLVNYKIKEKFNYQIKFDYYLNEMTDGNRKGFLFTDLRGSYKLGQGELYVEWMNIFNKQEYKYSYFSEMTTVDRQFKLRPWNLMLGYSFTL